MGRLRDLTGQRFFKLVVLSIVGRASQGHVTYRCRCDCGNELVVSGNRLGRKQPKQSCGCHKVNRIDPDRAIKRCSECKREKPIDQFGFSKTRNDGHAQHCKDCGPKVTKRYQGRYRSWFSKYHRNRRATDPTYKILNTLYCRLNRALKGASKTAHTLELLGCSFDEFLKYMEARFELGMTWQNHGRGKGCWQIDHIKPCCKFDLTDPEQQKQCFHYTNLQPLWAEVNQSKGGRYVV